MSKRLAAVLTCALLMLIALPALARRGGHGSHVSLSLDASAASPQATKWDWLMAGSPARAKVEAGSLSSLSLISRAPEKTQTAQISKSGALAAKMSAENLKAVPSSSPVTELPASVRAKSSADVRLTSTSNSAQAGANHTRAHSSEVKTGLPSPVAQAVASTSVKEHGLGQADFGNNAKADARSGFPGKFKRFLHL